MNRTVKILAVILAMLILPTLFSCSSREEEEKTDSAQTLPLQTSTERTPFTVLVGGTDRAGGLCDVLMLLTVSADRSSASVLQLPRDTYAFYGDGGYRKLNGIHKLLGGMDGARRYLQGALGVPIHKSLCLSPDALCALVDGLGGVEVEIPQDMDYVDREGGLTVHLKKGRVRLSGAEAEQFVRYRSGYLRGDLGRMDAQKLFMAALLRRLKEANVSELCSLLTLEGIETDLTVADCMGLAPTVLSLSEDRILFATAPGEAANAADGGSYYSLSAEGMKELLCRFFEKESVDFDPEEVFLNRKNPAFLKIYREKREARIYSARELSNAQTAFLPYS